MNSTKKKTYYIVESIWRDGKPLWSAYSKNILTSFGIYDEFFEIAFSFKSVEACKQKLITKIKSKHIKPKIVEVVEI